MKKDIEIPEVEGVFIAAVLEDNPEFRSRDWNAYIINTKPVPLEMILIVSRGYHDGKSTATMRHQIKVLPARSYAKIEYLQDEVLRLNNEFLVTFFEENKMFEKKFILPATSVKESALKEIPVMPGKGILAN